MLSLNDAPSTTVPQGIARCIKDRDNRLNERQIDMQCAHETTEKCLFKIQFSFKQHTTLHCKLYTIRAWIFQL